MHDKQQTCGIPSFRRGLIPCSIPLLPIAALVNIGFNHSVTYRRRSHLINAMLMG